MVQGLTSLRELKLADTTVSVFALAFRLPRTTSLLKTSLVLRVLQDLSVMSCLTNLKVLHITGEEH
jgi:hypothetical protein